MKKEEIYKNNELTLNELAAFADVHANSLSQVINEKWGRIFTITSILAGRGVHQSGCPTRQAALFTPGTGF
nr:hypothetical protein [Haliscomenobacter sp.]